MEVPINNPALSGLSLGGVQDDMHMPNRQKGDGERSTVPSSSAWRRPAPTCVWVVSVREWRPPRAPRVHASRG